jgi:chemotaxis signal transduction protein
MSAVALELRDMFDQSFAAAALAPEAAHTDFVCIRVGGEPAAIALGDITSLHADLRVVALPTPAPVLLGVAAVRAAVVPIYDLCAALGGGATGQARWIVLVRGGSVGFAVQGFDGHARIPDASIAPAPQPGHLRGRFSFGGQPRSVIDIGSVLTAITTRWGHGSPVKGQ